MNMPIDLDYLQSKSFRYIKNYVSLNDRQIFCLSKFFIEKFYKNKKNIEWPWVEKFP